MFWFALILILWAFLGVVAGVRSKCDTHYDLLIFMVFVPFIPIIARLFGII